MWLIDWCGFASGHLRWGRVSALYPLGQAPSHQVVTWYPTALGFIPVSFLCALAMATEISP